VYEQALRVDRWALSYEQVYRSSGGLLNLLDEPASQQDDRQLQELVKRFESDSESQEARKLAISLWREEPNELFSNLTPAQVWAGGGLKERQLAEQFAELLTEYSEDRTFLTLGEMISQSLNLLRQWLLSPASGKGGPSRQELIIEERNAILKRKIEVLESKGLLELSFLS
jgi:hypothetical protein